MLKRNSWNKFNEKLKWWSNEGRFESNHLINLARYISNPESLHRNSPKCHSPQANRLITRMRIILYLLCFGLSVGHTFAFYERCGRTDTQYLQSSCARFKRRLDCGILWVWIFEKLFSKHNDRKCLIEVIIFISAKMTRYSLVWPLSSSTANNTENTAKRPALKGIVRVGAVSADEHKSLAAQYNIKGEGHLSSN